mmetsp:Transcript_28769/g.60732  ORF Transcript_28769/g.60732 Transcript_28769/m.60732 type:complete len:103 (-) Transcript_28769:1499-1807(-)
MVPLYDPFLVLVCQNDHPLCCLLSSICHLPAKCFSSVRCCTSDKEPNLTGACYQTLTHLSEWYLCVQMEVGLKLLAFLLKMRKKLNAYGFVRIQCPESILLF